MFSQNLQHITEVLHSLTLQMLMML